MKFPANILRSIVVLPLFLGLVAAIPLSADQNLAGNVTVTGGAATGNLNVTGAIDSDSNTLTFGTQGASFGAAFVYTDNSWPSPGTADTFKFSLNRSPASWLWVHNTSTAAMRLDSAHQLTLFKADGSTAGLTFTPASTALSIGTATLTASGTGLSTNGAVSVGGTLTATGNLNFTGTDGALAVTSGGVVLSATGGSKNVTIAPSGTGSIFLNGKVGIGTSTPGTFLHVLGDTGANGVRPVRFESPSTDTGVSLKNTTAAGRTYSLFSSGTGSGIGAGLFSIMDDTAGLARMVITSTGNVGIGATAPSAKLEIAVPTGGADGIQITRPSSPTWQLMNYGPFYIQEGGVGPRLAVVSGGNVGIGTTTPNQKLDVIGTVRSQGTQMWGSGQLQVQWLNQADPVDQKITELIQQNGTFVGRFANDAYSVSDSWLVVQRTPGSYAVSSVNFPSGNLGVGTSTPDSKVALRAENLELSMGRAQVDGNGYARFGFASDYTQYIANNAYWNGSVWQYVNPGGYGGAATRFLNSSGVFQLDTASGGTNPVTWTTRLYVANSGNVGIGTTNPTQKLAVNGTIRAKEVIVDTGWSDYVFDESYRLAPLSEVEQHIKAEKHLPGIPSAQEVAEHGVSMGDMQSKLLAKIEELTLRQIAQEKQLNTQAARIAQLERDNLILQTR